MENVKIVAIVGMSGSGKSTAVRHMTEKGVPKVYFGGMILNEMERRGIEITADNEREFREQIRAEEGNDWVVRQAVIEVRRLIEAGQRRIVLDGVYSWSEYKILKKEFPKEMVFIAMVPPRRERHRRVADRAERPLTAEEINRRDYSEIENLEKGGPIANADYFICNDGSKEDMWGKVGKVLEDIDFFE